MLRLIASLGSRSLCELLALLQLLVRLTPQRPVLRRGTLADTRLACDLRDRRGGVCFEHRPDAFRRRYWRQLQDGWPRPLRPPGRCSNSPRLTSW